MQHSYTSNSLVSYLFNDCPILTKFEVDNWLAEGGIVLNEFETLRHTLSKLPRVTFQPTESSVNQILQLSRSY